MDEVYEELKDLTEGFSDITISYGFIVAGPVTDFQKIKRFIEEQETCRLVYMKKSLGRLFITDRDPTYSPMRR